jgi:outer membrane lipoprotein-sorting protein
MRFAPFLLAAALAIAPAIRADDAADARAIIEKAIKARGDKAGAVPAVTTWKEKMAINALGQRMDYDTEWTVQAPYKLRFRATTAIQGATLDVTVVVNDEKTWFLVNGFFVEVPPPQLSEMLTAMNRMWAASLTPLLTSDEFQLATAKEKEVNGKPAAGVAVRNGKRPIVTLYFDKETGLLVKREATVKDLVADDKEVLEEAVMSDYKEAGGRKYHTKVVVTRDGKSYCHSEVSMPREVEKPDPKLFEKPEVKQ